MKDFVAWSVIALVWLGGVILGVGVTMFTLNEVHTPGNHLGLGFFLLGVPVTICSLIVTSFLVEVAAETEARKGMRSVG